MHLLTTVNLWFPFCFFLSFSPQTFRALWRPFYICSIFLSNDVATRVLFPSYSSASFALTYRCHHGPWAPLTPLLSHRLLLAHWYSVGVHCFPDSTKIFKQALCLPPSGSPETNLSSGGECLLLLSWDCNKQARDITLLAVVAFVCLLCSLRGSELDEIWL